MTIKKTSTKLKATKAKPANKRVLIALSGGIDSAVSASLLLGQGYQVEAAFMKNWSSTTGLKYEECPWLADRQEALRVAAFLRIPLRTVDFEAAYRKTVLNYFFEEYKAGRTPNPDVMCNKEIKFKLLYQWAMDRGYDYIATGHYAQIKTLKNSKTATLALMKSKDAAKDQTYFIYNLKTEQLSRILFPIGGYKKTEVKALAKKLKLPNAERKESMGLCFVGKVRLKEFLDQKLKPKPGKILDMEGREIGVHQGLAYYTIGQRHGMDIGGPNGPWYVVSKDLKTNILRVTNNPEDSALYAKEIQIHSVNWISKPSKMPATITARYRHQGELCIAKVTDNHDQTYQVIFSKQQPAIASGQSLVMYDKDICLGGGIIV